jgi:hypothetical protein
MLWTIAVLLFVFWLLGMLMNVGGSLIHLLLVAAIVVFALNLISRARGVPTRRL